MDTNTILTRGAFDAIDARTTPRPSHRDVGQEGGSAREPVRVDPKDLEELMNRLKVMLYGSQPASRPHRR